MVENKSEYSSPLRIKTQTRERFDRLSLVESIKKSNKNITHDDLFNAFMDLYEKENADLVKFVNSQVPEVV
jgi:hypothetical protein